MTAQFTVAALVTALGLPPEARVDQRVPKKLLVEQGAPTAADRRQIQEGIEELQWIAALKPANIGVPAYQGQVGDADIEYLEIAVLTTRLRPQAKTARLMELIHRAIPYPLLLIAETSPAVVLSLGHKRWAQNEANKVVLDGGIVATSLPLDAPSAEALSTFIETLSLTCQRQATLLSLYQSWLDSVQALLAARLTGTFSIAISPEHAAARRQALYESERLEFEASRLRLLAAKEKQVARRVELNLALKRVQAQLVAARRHL